MFVMGGLNSQNKCNTCYGVVAMGQCYCQLGLEERIEIYRLHAAGKSMHMIARSLKRHVSTISREIDRNSLATKVWPGGYAPVRAQKPAEHRRRWDGRFKLARQPDLQDLVKDRLAMGHSPEQIAGRLTLEHGHTVISHESIYRFAYHARRKRTIGIACCHVANPGADASANAAAALPAPSSSAARSANEPSMSPIAPRQAIGKPTSCCSPNTAKACSSPMSDNRVTPSSTIHPIAKPGSQPSALPSCSNRSRRRYAKLSPSTMEQSLRSTIG